MDYNKISKTNEVEEAVISEPIAEAEESKPVKVVGKVSAVLLNLRAEPSYESEVVTILQQYEQLLIDEFENDEWYKVRVAKTGVEGYVIRECVEV